MFPILRLNYLILLEKVDILAALYERVLIPETVFRELQHPRTPSPVRRWIAQAPAWLEVHPVQASTLRDLIELDPGERDAISLAIALGIEVILLDDNEGRRAARNHRLQVTGTLGILERGAKQDLVDLPSALVRLQQIGFRIRTEIVEDLLAKNSRRKS